MIPAVNFKRTLACIKQPPAWNVIFTLSNAWLLKIVLRTFNLSIKIKSFGCTQYDWVLLKDDKFHSIGWINIYSYFTSWTCGSFQLGKYISHRDNLQQSSSDPTRGQTHNPAFRGHAVEFWDTALPGWGNN